MTTKTQKIQEACDAFAKLSQETTIAAELRGYWTPEEIAAVGAAKAALLDLMAEYGFVIAFRDGSGKPVPSGWKMMERKGIGHVNLLSGDSAIFTPAASHEAAKKQRAVRDRIAHTIDR